MSRKTFDFGLVTHCYALGSRSRGRTSWDRRLAELLGLSCGPVWAEELDTDFSVALVKSDLLSQTGEAVMADWIRLQAPPDDCDLMPTLGHSRHAYPSDRYRGTT